MVELRYQREAQRVIPEKISAKAFLATRFRATLLDIAANGEVSPTLAAHMVATLRDFKPTKTAEPSELHAFAAGVIDEAVSLHTKAARHSRLVDLVQQYRANVDDIGGEEAQWVAQHDAEPEGYTQEDLERFPDHDNALASWPQLWTLAEKSAATKKGGA